MAHTAPLAPQRGGSRVQYASALPVMARHGMQWLSDICVGDLVVRERQMQVEHTRLQERGDLGSYHSHCHVLLRPIYVQRFAAPPYGRAPPAPPVPCSMHAEWRGEARGVLQTCCQNKKMAWETGRTGVDGACGMDRRLQGGGGLLIIGCYSPGNVRACMHPSTARRGSRLCTFTVASQSVRFVHDVGDVCHLTEQEQD